MHHHHSSTSTVGISSLCDKVDAAVAKAPRATSARPLRPSSSPFSSPGASVVPKTNLLRNEGIDLFFLTRPASGKTSRSMRQPEFLDDTRSRVLSARIRKVVATPSDPSTAMAEVAVDPCVAGEDPAEIPGRWKHKSPMSQDDTWPLPPTDIVEDVPISASRTVSPADILHLLRTRGAQPRRPSKVPTPPAPPKLVDLVGGPPSARRTSVFGRPPTGRHERDASEKSEVDSDPSSSAAPPESGNGPQSETAATSDPVVSLSEAYRLPAATLRAASPKHDAAARDSRNDSSFASTRHGGVSDFWTAVDNEALLSPNRERKRLLCEKLHAVGMVHGGVVLDVPLLLDMPHFQSLHPVEGIVEALPSELPLSLRVTQGSSREHSSLGSGGAIPRGFLTAQQLLRESRATNFVMPKVYNPSPFTVSAAR